MAKVLRKGVETVRTRRGSEASRGAGESGAILILALVYLLAVGGVVAMLSTWATNDLNNSTHFTSANSLTLAATDMTDVAINYVRYNPIITSSQPVGVASPVVACWGGASIRDIPVINGDQIAVWCSTVWNPLSYVTRDVTFYACPSTVTAIDCEGNPLLLSEVRFDDYPPAPARSAPIQTLCSVWCGAGMTVVSWQWGAPATGIVTGVASIATFTNEPSDTSANGTTQAAVYVTDASGTPVAGDTVYLSEASGPADGIATMSAQTNSSGVAEFTNIVPTSPGSYTLGAMDGAATATSSTFAVSEQKSVIKVTSAAPTNATQGGSFSPVTATASSGDTVTIASGTPTICTMSGSTVNFKAVGTCTLNFTDSPSLNPNYAAATPVTQTFAVGGLAATQLAMTLTPVNQNGQTIVGASSTTNVSIKMVLENAVGAPVNSSGSTVVVLSDIGSGDFATSLGVGSNSPTLNVTFAPNTSTAYAYFLDENIGPDTISAVNGTTNWGSAPLTIQAGAPSQVAITPSTTTPAVSSTTNTSLTFQLEDQFGNAAVSTGSTTLSLSDSGPGFFSTANGVVGTSTLSITFGMGNGTETAYIGNQTSGSDLISAQNGASVWATSTVNFAPGTATGALITVNPTNPTKSNSTNALITLQLVDQFGNHVATSGVSFTLTDSGGGYFARTTGITGGTATYTVATNTSGIATAGFGDTIAQSVTITATSSGFSVTSPSITV